jgi:hypothetical protein
MINTRRKCNEKISTGEDIGAAWSIGKQYKTKLDEDK